MGKNEVYTMHVEIYASTQLMYIAKEKIRGFICLQMILEWNDFSDTNPFKPSSEPFGRR